MNDEGDDGGHGLHDADLDEVARGGPPELPPTDDAAGDAATGPGAGALDLGGPGSPAAAGQLHGHADDEDDEDDEAEPMAPLQSYATEAEALDAARLLVEHGVGASVTPVPAAELRDDESRGAYRVEVLPIDVPRAERVLGITEALDYDPANPPKLEKAPTPWKTLLIVWVAAMIIVPALAFYISYTLAPK